MSETARRFHLPHLESKSRRAAEGWPVQLAHFDVETSLQFSTQWFKIEMVSLIADVQILQMYVIVFYVTSKLNNLPKSWPLPCALHPLPLPVVILRSCRGWGPETHHRNPRCSKRMMSNVAIQYTYMVGHRNWSQCMSYSTIPVLDPFFTMYWLTSCGILRWRWLGKANVHLAAPNQIFRYNNSCQVLSDKKRKHITVELWNHCDFHDLCDLCSI